MSYNPEQQKRHCKDCTNFQPSLYGVIGWCVVHQSKAYELSMACDDYDDTTIF